MLLDNENRFHMSADEYYRRMLDMEGRGAITLERCLACGVYRAPHSCRRCTAAFRFEWGASLIAAIVIVLAALHAAS